MSKRVAAIFGIGVVALLAFSIVGVAAEKARDPLIYGLGSFVIPGLGQYLNGDSDKALRHFIIGVAIPVVGYYAGFISPFPVLIWAVTGLARFGWSVYSGFDAYDTAQAYNEKHGFAPPR